MPCSAASISAPSADAEGEEPEYAALEPHVERVLRILLADDTARLLNVNLPLAPRGMTWTRQAVRHYDGRVVPGKDPMGRSHFWFTVAPIEKTEPGTDLWAMERKYIAITPLSLDLTDMPGLDRLMSEHPLDAPPAEPQAEQVEEDET